ncbi:hypothetical protein ACIPF8_04735 [Collimonas sp. NPDC087041]|uniref:hypothetical protein n=1 Tax=Collimonas sp. NPDC087041 TaxID=3363960 RepID=UPI003829F409
MHSRHVSNIQKLLLPCAMWLGLATQTYASNCQIQLGDTTVEYGKMNPAALDAKPKSGGKVLLGRRRVSLTIVCQRPESRHRNRQQR